MNVYEEIDALKTLNINPVRYLVMPRLVASIVAVPALCMYVNVIGLLGGAIVSSVNPKIAVGMRLFRLNFQEVVKFGDVMDSLLKSVVFGVAVATAVLTGTVENLSIRTIRLRAGDGSVHIIPFSSVTSVTNFNRGIGNAAVACDQKPNHQFCDGRGVFPRAVGDIGAALGCRFQVDGVDARPGPDNQAQALAGLDGLGNDLFGPDDQDFGVANGGWQVFGGNVGVGDDRGTQCLQVRDHLRGNFVCDQNLHRVAFCNKGDGDALRCGFKTGCM